MRRLKFLRRHVIFILCAAVPVLPAGTARALDLSPAPLERKVRMNLWGARLSDFVQEVKNQAGVDILFYLPDFPDAGGAADLYLVSGETPLRSVLECLARRFSFRYRVSRSGRIEISKGYAWAGTDPALRFTRLDAVSPAGGGDTAALSRLMREFIKPLPLLDGEYRLAFEKSPLPDNPDSIRAVIVLPPVLAGYLEKGIACLSGHSGDYPPSAAVDAQRPHAVARRDPGDWEQLLGREFAMPRSRDLHSVLGEICDRTGFVVALAGPPAAAAADPAGLAGEVISLGRITGELAKRFNLGKRVFLTSGGLVFEAGSADDWETDRRGRELYWDGLAVAGFDARDAANRLGGGASLLNLARARVFPELWRDPACSLVYSDVSGRLAAVAPLNTVEALAEWLRDGSQDP